MVLKTTALSRQPPLEFASLHGPQHSVDRIPGNRNVVTSLPHPPPGAGRTRSARGKVVALDDYVAEIDADAPFDAIVHPDPSVPLGHRPLHRDRATDRIDDAGKFHEHAVAGGLDDAALVLGDLRIDELAAQRLEGVRASLPRRPPSAANPPPHRRRGSQ